MAFDEHKVNHASFGLKKGLAGKTRQQAKAHVGKWRDGVNMLSHHINAQMEFCKELRNNETLKRMLEEDPVERDRKRLAKFVDNMKADIRTLHNDICERILGKFVGGLTSPRAKAAPAGDAAASTPWQERTLELEEQLSKFVIGSTAEFGPQKLVELRIIQAFVDMVQLIQQANVSVDGARHGKAIAKLQSREATLKAELAAARRRISELNETVDILRGGQGKPVSQQTLKLDEAVTRMRLLEKEDAALRDNNATITSRNGVLEDMVVRLQQKLADALRQHKVETEWYQPRIAKLESSVATAVSTIQTVQMDVELLASMYKSGVDELEAMQVKVDAANKERGVMAAKLHAELRQVVGLRNELRRKDNIAIQLNAARRSWMESYSESKDAVAAAEAARYDCEQQLQATRSQVAQLEEDVSNLQVELESAKTEATQAQAERDEARAAARLTEEQKKEIAGELEVMTSKVVAAGLDEAGQNRYDVLQQQLSDANRMHAIMESQLERAHAETAGAKKEVERLRVMLAREGIDPDDAD